MNKKIFLSLIAIFKINGLNNEEFKDINYYPYDLVEF